MNSNIILGSSAKHPNNSVDLSYDSLKVYNQKLDQNKETIRDLESHLCDLLRIAKENELEYSLHIKKGLEKIKYLFEDNVTSKLYLLKEYEKSKELENEEKNLEIDIEKNKEVLNETEKGRLILEKFRLIQEINNISENVDKYSDMNNNEINLLKGSNNKNLNDNLNKEIEKLKSENEILNNINNYIEENKVFDVKEERRGFCSCMSGNINPNGYSINFK